MRIPRRTFHSCQRNPSGLGVEMRLPLQGSRRENERENFLQENRMKPHLGKKESRLRVDQS